MVKWGKEGEVVDQRAEIRLRGGGVVDCVVVTCGSPGLLGSRIGRMEGYSGRGWSNRDCMSSAREVTAKAVADQLDEFHGGWWKGVARSLSESE